MRNYCINRKSISELRRLVSFVYRSFGGGKKSKPTCSNCSRLPMIFAEGHVDESGEVRS
jgi:hypothetical protein